MPSSEPSYRQQWCLRLYSHCISASMPAPFTLYSSLCVSTVHSHSGYFSASIQSTVHTHTLNSSLPVATAALTVISATIVTSAEPTWWQSAPSETVSQCVYATRKKSEPSARGHTPPAATMVNPKERRQVGNEGAYNDHDRCLEYAVAHNASYRDSPGRVKSCC